MKTISMYNVFITVYIILQRIGDNDGQKYLAHISEDREQTVYEHCENVSRYAELEARSVGLGNTLKIAGLLHDVGKLTDEFNEYIHKAVENPDSVRRVVSIILAQVQSILWIMGLNII